MITTCTFLLLRLTTMNLQALWVLKRLPGSTPILVFVKTHSWCRWASISLISKKQPNRLNLHILSPTQAMVWSCCSHLRSLHAMFELGGTRMSRLTVSQFLAFLHYPCVHGMALCWRNVQIRSAVLMMFNRRCCHTGLGKYVAQNSDYPSIYLST